MNFPTASSGACAVHPSAAAIGTCQRCGNYMCAECQSATRPEVCESCMGRVGSFPYSRENFDVVGALTFSFERFKENWMVPTALSAAFLVVAYAFAFVVGIAQGAVAMRSPELSIVIAVVGQLVSTVINVVMLAALGRVVWVALEPGEVTMDHVAQGLRRTHFFLAQQLAMILIYAVVAAPFGILVAAGIDPSIIAIAGGCTGIVLFPVLIYVVLGVSYVGMEAVCDPDVGVVEAFKRSWTVARGKRLTVFGASLLGVLVVMAGFLACCVGVIPATAVVMMYWAATYRGLRGGLFPEPRPFR